MTGEYENQRRFVQTMRSWFPIVLLIIFVLLYIVYHSALEAAHVMLAVPFALSGGVFLQKAAWLQLQRRRLGRLHRALRHRRADRRGHGRLSRGDREEKRMAERGAAFTYAPTSSRP